MRIAIAVRNLGSLSGVSRVARELARGILRKGHEAVLLSRRAPGDADLAGLRVPTLPFPSLGRAWSFDRMARWRAERLRADILHGHGDLTAQDVLTVNNVDPAEAESAGRATVGSPGTLYVRARQWGPRTRRVVAVSRRVRSDIERFYGVGGERVRVIYWGIDAERFSPEGGEAAAAGLRRRLGLPQNARIFLSLISGDARRRNIRGLVSAFARARLPDDHALLVVGDPSCVSVPGARELLAKGRLKTLPKSRDPEDIYRGCDFFALAAHYETFGLSALEAMACGRPVVVSSACGVSELLSDGENALLLQDPGDSDALARALERLALEPGLARRLAVAGLAVAQARRWDRAVEEYLELYREVLLEKSG